MSAPRDQRPTWHRVVALVQVVAMVGVFLSLNGPAEVAYALREGELLSLGLMLMPFVAMTPAVVVLTTARPRGVSIAWVLTWVFGGLALVGLALLGALARGFQH